MEALALRYRPTSFDDLVGQRATNVVLRQMVVKDAVPAALLFAGCRGTGKTTTARILAAALNCEADERPCGHCPSCKSVFNGTSLDVLEIDAASNGGVDNIRELRSNLLYNLGGRHRIVILDEAHSLSLPAFNACLKLFEEPPLGVVFVLATTDPHRIPETVMSRLSTFYFGRIPVADIAARLAAIAAAEQLNVEPALLTLLAQRADGALRDAIMSLDQMARAGIGTVADYIDLMGEVDYGPDLLATIADGNLAAAFARLDDVLTRTGDASAIADTLTACLRDLLVLRSGGALHHQGAALDARTRLARTLDVRALYQAINVLWELKTKVRPTDDPRTGLDLAVATLCERLAPPPVPASAPAGPRKLSLAEMRAMG